MRPIAPTKFLARNRRTIYVSSSKKGGTTYFTFGGKDGQKKQYSPKAAFKKTPDGGLRKLVKSNSVPNKIAPAMLKGRKVRANKGKARALVTSPGGTTYKGMGAATRRKTVPKRMRANPFASLMMM